MHECYISYLYVEWVVGGGGEHSKLGREEGRKGGTREGIHHIVEHNKKNTIYILHKIFIIIQLIVLQIVTCYMNCIFPIAFV